VDDILDLGCHSWAVHHDDQSPLIIINRVGLPLVLSTHLNFPHFHPIQDGRPKMIGTPSLHTWKNPMQWKGNGSWVFTLMPLLCPIFQKELIGGFWGRSWT